MAALSIHRTWLMCCNPYLSRLIRGRVTGGPGATFHFVNALGAQGWLGLGDEDNLKKFVAEIVSGWMTKGVDLWGGLTSFEGPQHNNGVWRHQALLERMLYGSGNISEDEWLTTERRRLTMTDYWLSQHHILTLSLKTKSLAAWWRSIVHSPIVQDGICLNPLLTIEKTLFNCFKFR